MYTKQLKIKTYTENFFSLNSDLIFNSVSKQNKLDNKETIIMHEIRVIRQTKQINRDNNRIN